MLELLHQHREGLPAEICRCQNDIERSDTAQQQIEALISQVSGGAFQTIADQIADK
ncbi:hypothetical protein BAU01nite_30800 [Brevibacterium aurantiacum]|nr:hypothetical protein BAU01nite_30800 [Brevibacterium aurantiacum]